MRLMVLGRNSEEKSEGVKSKRNNSATRAGETFQVFLFFFFLIFISYGFQFLFLTKNCFDKLGKKKKKTK